MDKRPLEHLLSPMPVYQSRLFRRHTTSADTEADSLQAVSYVADDDAAALDRARTIHGSDYRPATDIIVVSETRYGAKDRQVLVIDEAAVHRPGPR